MVSLRDSFDPSLSRVLNDEQVGKLDDEDDNNVDESNVY